MGVREKCFAPKSPDEYKYFINVNVFIISAPQNQNAVCGILAIFVFYFFLHEQIHQNTKKKIKKYFFKD